MIHIDDNEIGNVTAEQLDQEKNACMEYLSGDQAFDLIIDCTNSLLDLADLKNIKAMIESKGRTLVVLVSKSDLDSLAMNWNVVPTREEAQDFISFERVHKTKHVGMSNFCSLFILDGISCLQGQSRPDLIFTKVYRREG